MKNATVTVIFYAADARTITRERTYATAALASRAMARAAKRKEICTIKRVRTADDPPTCHH